MANNTEILATRAIIWGSEDDVAKCEEALGCEGLPVPAMDGERAVFLAQAAACDRQTADFVIEALTRDYAELTAAFDVIVVAYADYGKQNIQKDTFFNGQKVFEEVGGDNLNDYVDNIFGAMRELMAA